MRSGYMESPGVIDYLNSFLDKVKADVTEDLVPHVFTREPRTKTFTMTTDQPEKYKFLNLWFTKQKQTLEEKC